MNYLGTGIFLGPGTRLTSLTKIYTYFIISSTFCNFSVKSNKQIYIGLFGSL